MNVARTLSNAATALLGLALGATSHAAWETTPQVEMSALRDDNLRLLPNDLALAGNADGTTLDARLRAASTGERGNLFFEPRVRIDRYSGDENEDFNGTDTFLRARGRYDWSQASVGFLADYDQQDIRDAELTEAVPDDPDIADPTDPDTGLVVTDEDRKRLLLRPTLDVRLSERSSLVFASEILDVSYTGAEVAGRADFKDTEVSAGILRNVDNRNEVSARLIAAEYVADFNQNETTTFGVEGTFRRTLSRDWAFNLAAGVSRSDYSFLDAQLQPIDNADTSFTYLIGFRQRTDRNTINIDVSRETAPNSGGFLALRDQIRFYLSRAISQRLRGEVGVRGYTTKTLDDVVANDDRDYLRVDLALEWAMTERLFVKGGYAFTAQKFSQDLGDANANTVFVGLMYRGLAGR